MRRSPLATVALAVLVVVTLLAGPGRADIPGVVYNSANGHYYKLYTTPSTWASAKSSAESLGGYLVTITSQAENSWLQTNVGTSSTPWLGGTDEVTEGTWAWVTSESFTYTNWGPGEPNNVGNEDYLQFRSDGMWNDVPGASTYTYIVEWDTDPNGPPEVPTNLRATAVNDARVDLVWNDPSSRETGFEVERSVNGGAYSLLTSPAANAVSATDSGVVAETTYSYRIRSVGSGGSSSWSNVATVTTPPPTVTGLTATLVTATSARLDWTNVATTATSIEVERGLGNPGASFVLRGSTAATSTTYLDTGAAPESTLAYRVRVVGPGGRSRYSAEAYVTTPPATPSGLVLTAVSDTRVVLGWNDNSALETGYEIERGLGASPTSYTSIVTLPVNYRAYTDDDVQPETTYSYRVRARNDSGGSDWSARGSVTTQPRTPANVAAAPASSNRMRVTWSDVSAREQGFDIERAVGAEGVFEHLAAVSYGAQEYIDATAHPKLSYRYRIAALSLDGKSNWAESGTARMPAMLVVRSLTVPATGPAKAPPRVVVVGEFDVGGTTVDLLQPSTLTIGGASLALPAGVAKGRGIRAEAEGARLDLKPVGTTSRVGFLFQGPASLFPGLDANGDVRVAFDSGEYRAVGSVRLSGGAFQPPARGTLVDPECELITLAVSLKPSAADAFTLKGSFATAGSPPASPPQVVVRCGSSVFVCDPSLFKVTGNRLLLKQKVDGGTRLVKLDFAKGLATIVVRGGTEVGTLPKGSVPLLVEFSIGSLTYADTLTVKCTGGSARY
jgi:hypothetical protein